MKGLELSRAYYEAFGRPMLEREFPDVMDRIAVGLAGHGSECFGFDDEISRDHDFEPGFCLWITDEDDRDFGFRLFRAYRRLPGEFEGIKLEDTSLFGSESKGVRTIREFSLTKLTMKFSGDLSNKVFIKNIESFTAEYFLVFNNFIII